MASATVLQPRLDDLGVPLIDVTFTVVDLETTGLHAERDRITEIGAVKVRAGEVLGEFATFVHPGRPIPASVAALTGITDEMVRDAPRATAAISMLFEFMRGTVFVAHNARFDLGFLRAAAQRCGLERIEPVVIDTARLARRLLRDEIRNVRLATLASHLRCVHRPNHRALADARATVDVLHGLFERAGPLGATTLEDVRALTTSRSDRRFRRISLVREAPRACGVYRFVGADGEVLYVGKASDLRSRLRSYFGQDDRRGMEQLIRETDHVSWTLTPTVIEAEIRELREIQTHLPRFNRRSTRPTAAVHVALTDEAFPRLSVVGEPRPNHLRTLGPVTSRTRAVQLTEALEEATGLRPCTLRIRRSQDHPPCILKDLGRCAAPCDGSQSAADYLRHVDAFDELLADPSKLVGRLRSRMDAYARAGRFEQAADARGRLHAVARTLSTVRRYEALIATEELVVVWPATGEGVIVHHGQLVGSFTSHDVDAATPPLTPTLPDDPPGGRDGMAEALLVLAALERPGARVVSVTGTYAQPWEGAEVVEATCEQARAMATRLRRDRQLVREAR